MANSARVFGPGCGPITASAMFVGEAPGRLGADTSQLPFHGDKAGHNFESLLEHVELSRYDVFVTNAVLCNPKTKDGNNATPSPLEISNCAGFLKEQIELIKPNVVVTLGAVALSALNCIQSHSISLRAGVRRVHQWAGRQLIPAYHPGQRAMVHRSFANQLADYQFIAEHLRSRVKKRRSTSKSTGLRAQKIAAVARVLLDDKRELSYFALHKLFFLAEVKHLEQTGKRLTGAYIIRQKDGPYCVELNAKRLPLLLSEFRVVSSSTGPVIARVDQRALFVENQRSNVLSVQEESIVRECVRRYGMCTPSRLKTAAYMARPMRDILRKERLTGMNLFNSPILPAASREL
jgi:uracil-DNA glycosylase family 4